MSTGAVSFSTSQPTATFEPATAPAARPFLSGPMTITISAPTSPPAPARVPAAHLSFSSGADTVTAAATHSPSTKLSSRTVSTDSLSPQSAKGRHLRRKRSQSTAVKVQTAVQAAAQASPTHTPHTLQTEAASDEGGGGGGGTDTDSLGTDTDTDTDTDTESLKVARKPANPVRQTLLTITPKHLGKVIEFLRGDDVKSFLQFNRQIRGTAAKITSVNFSNSLLVPKKSRAFIVDGAPWYACFSGICGAPEIKTFGSRDIVRYFPGVHAVNLSLTEFTSASISYLPRLHALSQLDLSYAKELISQDFRELKRANGLGTLILRNCESVSTDSLDEICNLVSLKRLNVAGCKKIDKFGFRKIKQLRNLTSLDASECPLLTDFTITSISELPELKHLYLNKCIQLTNRAFVNLSRFETLKTIDISHLPWVTSTGLRYLEPLKKSLLSLNISFCDHLDENAIDAINCFVKLRILKMDDCSQITAEMVGKLRLPIIRELHIRNIGDVTSQFVKKWCSFRPKTKVSFTQLLR